MLQLQLVIVRGVRQISKNIFIINLTRSIELSRGGKKLIKNQFRQPKPTEPTLVGRFWLEYSRFWFSNILNRLNDFKVALLGSVKVYLTLSLSDIKSQVILKVQKNRNAKIDQIEQTIDFHFYDKVWVININIYVVLNFVG